MNVRQDAINIFNAGVAAVQPAQLLPLHLAVDKDAITICNHIIPYHTFNNMYVIGAGKAAAAMAVAIENIIGDFIKDGLVVTKYGHTLPCQKIKVIEAAHPVPDEQGVEAVNKTIQLLQQVTKNDIVICLISGGASALWCDVPAGIALEKMQQTFDELIKCGANIQEINTVRKHLSSIKGGQLIQHCNGARVFTLIISDVPGDDCSVIASGPTVGDNTTFEDAYNILLKYHLFHQLPASIQTFIKEGRNGKKEETPKPGDAVFLHTVNTIIGNNTMAVDAAANKAAELGYIVEINKTIIAGDVEEVAKCFVQTAEQYNSNKPVCFVQGGETTVKVTGSGKGGRNQHFVLATLLQLYKNKMDNVLVLSGGTDGTDGPTDATGAVGDSSTIKGAIQKNISPETYLHNHDAYHFFEHTNELLITGATQTNVMDLMIAIVY